MLTGSAPGGRSSTERPRPAPVGQVPDAVPVMSPEDAQARLGELRASCVATWEPPDPVALASFLREVADALQALEPDLSVIDTLRGAAADVDDAEALFGAGWELVEVDLDALAVTPLARALTLAPRDVAIVNELALALEAAGSPAEAARLYRENAWAVEESETAAGLSSHFAAMVGDWSATQAERCGSTPRGSMRSSGSGPCDGLVAPPRCTVWPG